MEVEFANATIIENWHFLQGPSRHFDLLFNLENLGEEYIVRHVSP